MTRRRDLADLAAIAVVAFLLFAVPIVRREVFVFRDHIGYFLPLRFHTAAELRAGHLPLWNPYNASGEPWLANPQTCVFYPPAWIFLAVPFPAAYMLFLAFHIALTGCGAYLLFRRSAAAAVALMFAGPTLSLLDVNNNLATFAWIPLILWLAADRDHDRRVDAIAIAIAFLGGEPFFAAVAAIAYAVVVRRARDVAVVAALAVALCAVELVPFIEWLRGTNRAVVTGSDGSFPIATWLRMATPPHVSREGEPLLVMQYIPLPYAGLLVPAAAVAGIAIAVARKKVHAIAGWLALVVACVLLGRESVFTALRARYPARMMSIAIIGIVGLAAFAWNEFRPRRKWVDWAVAIAIAIELVPRAAPLLHTIAASELAGPIDPAIGRSSQILRLPIGADEMTDPPAWLFGYQNLYARRFDTGSGTPAVPLRYLQLYQAATKGQRIDVIDFLSAGFIFCDRPLPLPPVARIHDVTIYANRGALPLARFRTDGGRLIPAAARIGDNSVDVEVNAASAGLLTIAQRDAPGWRVFVDGREAPKLDDNGIFRAVRLGAGSHRVEWRYLPATFIAGAAISIVALLYLAVISAKPIILYSRRAPTFASHSVSPGATSQRSSPTMRFLAR